MAQDNAAVSEGCNSPREERVNFFAAYFASSPSQLAVLKFLLLHEGSFRLARVVDYTGFSRRTIYKAVEILHSKGWIQHRFVAAPGKGAETWLSLAAGLPGDFKGVLRSALASSCGAASWDAFTLHAREGGRGPTDRREGRAYRAAPKTWAEKRRSDAHAKSEGRNLAATRPRDHTTAAGNPMRVMPEGRYQAGKHRGEVQTKQKIQRVKIYDPQGVPHRRPGDEVFLTKITT